jgi:ATP-binding cassette, subfamily C, bacterial LapB
MWLLDEPTANMDDETERRAIHNLSQAVKPEQTLIIVTHKMALLGLVQRLVVMQQGRIVLDGPRDAVLEHIHKQQQAAAQAAAAQTVTTVTPRPQA